MCSIFLMELVFSVLIDPVARGRLARSCLRLFVRNGFSGGSIFNNVRKILKTDTLTPYLLYRS